MCPENTSILKGVEVIFWIGIAVVVYTYVIYPLTLWGISIFKSKKLVPQRITKPSVALVICAYNEQDYVISKLKNSLQLKYPGDLLTIYFVTDGSDDDSHQLLNNHPLPAGTKMKILHDPIRAGKVGAMNRAMKLIREEVTIFTDANSMLNPEAIEILTTHLHDPETGMVAGEKRIIKKELMDAARGGEGIYWKYESWLKSLESHVQSTIGAAGELFAIRTNLYETIPPDTIIEDFYLSMKIALKGFRIKYAPNAKASESGSLNIMEENKRKVRIASGAFQVMGRLKELGKIRKNPILAWQYFSHKVLRWVAVPFLLPVIFISNGMLSYYYGGLYNYLMLLQGIFYLLAIIGYKIHNKRRKNPLVFIPFYMVFMNVAIVKGFIRYHTSRESVNWEKTIRSH